MRKKRINQLLSILIGVSLLVLFALLGFEAVSAIRAAITQKATKDLYPVSGSALFDSIFVSAIAEEDDFILDKDENSFISQENTPAIGEIITISEGSTEWEEVSLDEEQPVLRDDFKALFDANPDIIGWLTVGEHTDNPVVQRDNAFYLTHNFFGRSDSNGTLFLNQANCIWPRDKILLIHGHAMRSGQMFGSLRKYKDEAYVREHPIIEFRTIYEEEKHFFVPVAGFDASMEMGDKWFFDALQFNFASIEEQENYLKQINSLSYWHTPLEWNCEDNLLILITCSYLHANGRFLLVCRELRENETVETVTDTLNNAAWMPIE